MSETEKTDDDSHDTHDRDWATVPGHRIIIDVEGDGILPVHYTCCLMEGEIGVAIVTGPSLFGVLDTALASRQRGIESDWLSPKDGEGLV